MINQKSKEQLTAPFRNKRLSPLKAIKNHCLYECCVGDRKSLQFCNVDCLLKPYRFGKMNLLCGNMPQKSITDKKPKVLPLKFSETSVLRPTLEPSTDRQELLKPNEMLTL